MKILCCTQKSGLGNKCSVSIIYSLISVSDWDIFCSQENTGYTSQGSLACPGRSADFDLTGPADFLLGTDPHRALTYRFTDFLNIYLMIIRPATYKKLLQYT